MDEKNKWTKALKAESHAHAKLGEVGVIVLIYTIMHEFHLVRNRPWWNLTSIYHNWEASDSQTGWWLKQHSF